MKNIALLLSFLFAALSAQAKLVVELTIENQEVYGTDLFFDIYLTRHATSGGDIYLAESDLVLTFNAQFFTDPTFSVVENGTDGTGFCLFTPVSGQVLDEPDCRTDYTTGIAPSKLADGVLIINLYSPEPVTLSDFAARIARIDGEVGKHRLGRFRISGVSDHNGTAGLTWAESFGTSLTKVYSYQTYTPWIGGKVEVISTTPPDHPLDSIILSTEEPTAQFGIRNIFPNPATAEVQVSFFSPAANDFTVSIVGESGAIVWQQKMALRAGENVFQVATNALPQGRFTLVLRGEDGVFFSEKFLKVR